MMTDTGQRLHAPAPAPSIAPSAHSGDPAHSTTDSDQGTPGRDSSEQSAIFAQPGASGRSLQPNEKSAKPLNKPVEVVYKLFAKLSQAVRKCQQRLHKVPTTEWRTTLWKFGPLTGFGSVVLAIACIFCSLAILMVSDGQPVSQWQYQPSTYLAIFTTISDQSMKYAALQGAVIAWWLGTLQTKGISLASLHNNWNMGNGLVGAVMAGRRMNLFAFACICSTFVAVDGPLLQQSSKVEVAAIPDDQATAVTLKFLNIAPEIPTNYTGSFPTAALPAWTTEDMNAWAPPVKFTKVWRDFQTNATIESHVRGCSGSCQAQIQAPAFSIVGCEIISGPVSFNTSTAASDENIWPMNTYNPFNDVFTAHTNVSHNTRTAFYSNVLWTMRDKEYLNVTTISNEITDPHACAGTFNFTTCQLQSAIAAYDVVVTNLGDPHDSTCSSLTLPLPVAYPKIIAPANNTLSFTRVSQARQNATLIGIAQGLFNVVLRQYSLQQLGVGDWNMALDPALTAKNVVPGSNPLCSTYTDPFADIMDSLNRLAFRVGLAAVDILQDDRDGLLVENFLDPGLSLNQTVQGHLTGNWNVYRTNYYWFYGATAAQVVCILVILPLYWGWWRLGRAVSFSPLEIAKAFDAPLLAKHHSNKKSDHLAKGLKQEIVRYGVVDVKQAQTSKLSFAPPTIARTPMRNAKVDT